jgi:hypothetical protein
VGSCCTWLRQRKVLQLLNTWCSKKLIDNIH